MDLFIRYLAKTNRLPNKFATRAYDLRIFYILDGEGDFLLDGQRHSVAKGSFCYCPAGCEYYPISSDKNPLYFIVINFDLSCKNRHLKNTVGTVKASEFDKSRGIFSHEECEVELYRQPFIISSAQFVEEILLSSVEEYKKNTVYAGEIAEAYLKCALLKIAEFKNQKGHSLYNEIVDYISVNYKSIRSNEDIGCALGYHPFYLSRVTLQHSGLTLHKYVQKYRLAKAAELLTFSNMSVSEISREIGIDNPNHFCNIFSKEYGRSPSAYRNSIKII